mgnify:CR=1 FL=1
MAILLYVRRKDWLVKPVTIETMHRGTDYLKGSSFAEEISNNVVLVGDINEAQRLRIEEITCKCPVHLTLESGPMIVNKVTVSQE